MTVVLLHGLYQGLGHLEEITFPSSKRAVIIDMLGYGSHAHAMTPETLEAQADHVVGEMDRLGISKAAILGHSVGGAVAMLLAARHPGRVEAVVNVEGNVTLADAFWSSKVAAMSRPDAEALLEGFRSDVPGWISGQKMEPTAQRVAWARRMFDAQPASSVQALARAVVTATSSPGYLPMFEGVLDSGIPVHLMAGERSRSGWTAPEAFLRRAASFTVQPRVGHMMPLEDPEAFLSLVASRVG